MEGIIYLRRVGISSARYAINSKRIVILVHLFSYLMFATGHRQYKINTDNPYPP